MAGTAVRRRLSWQLATVAAVTEETDSVRTIALDLPDWPGHRASGSTVPARLLYSSRTLADVIYREELDHYAGSAEVRYTLTRSQPPGWGGFSGRVDDAMLARIVWPASERPLAFICGPTLFVEAVAELLVARHYSPSRVKTERFGGA